MNAIIGRNKREKYSSQWWVIGSASGQISDFHFTKSKEIKNQLLARPLCTGQPCWQILGEQGWVDLSPSLAHRTALQCIFANSIINSFYVHLNVQLSNLWRKPNSTSIGFDTATKTGKTRMSLKSCGVSFDPFWSVFPSETRSFDHFWSKRFLLPSNYTWNSASNGPRIIPKARF